jgi:hypothetical protein
MLLSWEKFLEANLNLNELDKHLSGEIRGDKLVNKLITKSPIRFNNIDYIVDQMFLNGEWVNTINAIKSFTTNGKWDSLKARDYFIKNGRYLPVFKAGGKKFKLNQITKTRDFGSKGAGRNTRLFESIQSLFLTLRQYNNSDLTIDNYESLINKYFTNQITGLNISIELTIEKIYPYLRDKNWLYTFIDVTNKIFNKGVLNNKIYYDVYQISSKSDDSPYKQIISKFNKFRRNENINSNFSKYNPSDVYLISNKDKVDILNSIKNTENLKQLTDLIDKLFDDKKLISISLNIKIENYQILKFQNL